MADFNVQQAGTLTPEMYAQQQAVNRQQQLANMLLQNSQQQPQGQMISGHYVAPSFFQNLVPLANAAAGQYLANKADTQGAALAQQLRQQGSQDLENVMTQLQGRPELPSKELAGPAYNGVAPSIQYPAVQANPQAALQTALQSESPQVKALIPSLIQNTIPKKTDELINYEAAKADGFKGTFNDYKNQLTPYQKAELGLRGAELNKSQVVETPQGVMLVNPRTGSVAPAMLNGQPIMGKNNQTESQAKANVFHNQMTSATNELNRIQNEGFNPNSKIAQTEINMAGGMLNALTPAKAQQFKQAQNQWTEAYLRFKTGAGTNAHEIEANRQTYFPVFGDSPEQIDLKNRMRTQAENDMAIAAGKNAQFGAAPQPLNGQAQPSTGGWGQATVVK